jgi:hypothetical protein
MRSEYDPRDHMCLKQRLMLSLADNGWKARKRRFETGIFTGVTMRIKPLMSGMVFNLFVCESDEPRLAPGAA